MRKKFSDKIGVDDEKDGVKQFFDGFARTLSWYMGSTAYKLIKVKDAEKDKKEKEDKKDQKDAPEKMHDLILQSKLLSGGIENRFVRIFSPENISEMQDLLFIIRDNKLRDYLATDVQPDDQDRLLASIIFEGRDENTDRVIHTL